jgi:hypothetical protein
METLMTSSEKAFYDGFYGDDFREFKKLGVETVRGQYEAGQFPSERQHNAAGEWLGRKRGEQPSWNSSRSQSRSLHSAPRSTSR